MVQLKNQNNAGNLRYAGANEIIDIKNTEINQ